MAARTPVYVERGEKRTFACAVDRPGWCRSGRTEGEALSSLVDHAPRYAAAVKGIGRFATPKSVDDLEVVGRVKGGASTDFGVPSEEIPPERKPIDATELRRLLRILDAAWATFDAAVAAAEGLELRKGPRGGGRDIPRMVAHVFEADEAYCHQLGTKRHKRQPSDDAAAATARLRESIRAAVTARATGGPVPDPNKVTKPWSPRYAVRRVAWHSLDHAWEIEDRSAPGPET